MSTSYPESSIIFFPLLYKRGVTTHTNPLSTQLNHIEDYFSHLITSQNCPRVDYLLLLDFIHATEQLCKYRCDIKQDHNGIVGSNNDDMVFYGVIESIEHLFQLVDILATMTNILKIFSQQTSHTRSDESTHRHAGDIHGGFNNNNHNNHDNSLNSNINNSGTLFHHISPQHHYDPFLYTPNPLDPNNDPLYQYTTRPHNTTRTKAIEALSMCCFKHLYGILTLLDHNNVYHQLPFPYEYHLYPSIPLAPSIMKGEYLIDVEISKFPTTLTHPKKELSLITNTTSSPTRTSNSLQTKIAVPNSVGQVLLEYQFINTETQQQSTNEQTNTSKSTTITNLITSEPLHTLTIDLDTMNELSSHLLFILFNLQNFFPSHHLLIFTPFILQSITTLSSPTPLALSLMFRLLSIEPVINISLPESFVLVANDLQIARQQHHQQQHNSKNSPSQQPPHLPPSQPQLSTSRPSTPSTSSNPNLYSPSKRKSRGSSSSSNDGSLLALFSIFILTSPKQFRSFLDYYYNSTIRKTLVWSTNPSILGSLSSQAENNNNNNNDNNNNNIPSNTPTHPTPPINATINEFAFFILNFPQPHPDYPELTFLSNSTRIKLINTTSQSTSKPSSPVSKPIVTHHSHLAIVFETFRNYLDQVPRCPLYLLYSPSIFHQPHNSLSTPRPIIKTSIVNNYRKIEDGMENKIAFSLNESENEEKDFTLAQYPLSYTFFDVIKSIHIALQSPLTLINSIWSLIQTRFETDHSVIDGFGSILKQNGQIIESNGPINENNKKSTHLLNIPILKTTQQTAQIHPQLCQNNYTYDHLNGYCEQQNTTDTTSNNNHTNNDTTKPTTKKIPLTSLIPHYIPGHHTNLERTTTASIINDLNIWLLVESKLFQILTLIIHHLPSLPSFTILPSQRQKKINQQNQQNEQNGGQKPKELPQLDPISNLLSLDYYATPNILIDITHIIGNIPYFIHLWLFTQHIKAFNEMEQQLIIDLTPKSAKKSTKATKSIDSTAIQPAIVITQQQRFQILQHLGEFNPLTLFFKHFYHYLSTSISHLKTAHISPILHCINTGCPKPSPDNHIDNIIELDTTQVDVNKEKREYSELYTQLQPLFDALDEDPNMIFDDEMYRPALNNCYYTLGKQHYDDYDNQHISVLDYQSEQPRFVKKYLHNLVISFQTLLHCSNLNLLFQPLSAISEIILDKPSEDGIDGIGSFGLSGYYERNSKGTYKTTNLIPCKCSIWDLPAEPNLKGTSQYTLLKHHMNIITPPQLFVDLLMYYFTPGPFQQDFPSLLSFWQTTISLPLLEFFNAPTIDKGKPVGIGKRGDNAVVTTPPMMMQTIEKTNFLKHFSSLLLHHLFPHEPLYGFYLYRQPLHIFPQFGNIERELGMEGVMNGGGNNHNNDPLGHDGDLMGIGAFDDPVAEPHYDDLTTSNSDNDHDEDENDVGGGIFIEGNVIFEGNVQIIANNVQIGGNNGNVRIGRNVNIVADNVVINGNVDIDPFARINGNVVEQTTPLYNILPRDVTGFSNIPYFITLSIAIIQRLLRNGFKMNRLYDNILGLNNHNNSTIVQTDIVKTNINESTLYNIPLDIMKSFTPTIAPSQHLLTHHLPQQPSSSSSSTIHTQNTLRLEYLTKPFLRLFFDSNMTTQLMSQSQHQIMALGRSDHIIVKNVLVEVAQGNGITLPLINQFGPLYTPTHSPHLMRFINTSSLSSNELVSDSYGIDIKNNTQDMDVMCMTNIELLIDAVLYLDRLRSNSVL